MHVPTFLHTQVPPPTYRSQTRQHGALIASNMQRRVLQLSTGMGGLGAWRKPGHSLAWTAECSSGKGPGRLWQCHQRTTARFSTSDREISPRLGLSTLLPRTPPACFWSQLSQPLLPFDAVLHCTPEKTTLPCDGGTCTCRSIHGRRCFFDTTR